MEKTLFLISLFSFHSITFTRFLLDPSSSCAYLIKCLLSHVNEERTSFNVLQIQNGVSNTAYFKLFLASPISWVASDDNGWTTGRWTHSQGNSWGQSAPPDMHTGGWTRRPRRERGAQGASAHFGPLIEFCCVVVVNHLWWYLKSGSVKIKCDPWFYATDQKRVNLKRHRFLYTLSCNCVTMATFSL